RAARRARRTSGGRARRRPVHDARTTHALRRDSRVASSPSADVEAPTYLAQQEKDPRPKNGGGDDWLPTDRAARAGDAIGPEQYEFIQRDQREHDDGLLPDGEHANL